MYTPTHHSSSVTVYWEFLSQFSSFDLGTQLNEIMQVLILGISHHHHHWISSAPSEQRSHSLRADSTGFRKEEKLSYEFSECYNISIGRVA